MKATTLAQAILATVLALGTVGAQAANWVRIDSKDNDVSYYDRSSVRTVKGNKQFWYRYVVEDGYQRSLQNGTKYDEYKQIWTINCASHRARIDDEYYYYEGSVVHKNLGIGRWENIIPDTLGADMHSRVCR